MMKKLYNNKYTKLEKIGGGSFGCVYLVEDESTHKKFAMKKFYLDNVTHIYFYHLVKRGRCPKSI